MFLTPSLLAPQKADREPRFTLLLMLKCFHNALTGRRETKELPQRNFILLSPFFPRLAAFTMLYILYHWFLCLFPPPSSSILRKGNVLHHVNSQNHLNFSEPRNWNFSFISSADHFFPSTRRLVTTWLIDPRLLIIHPTPHLHGGAARPSSSGPDFCATTSLRRATALLT